MSKIDLKRELKHLYKPPARSVATVDVPAMRFLMIDGQGDPNNSTEYAEAVEALFSVSYVTKFSVKRSLSAVDYSVMPLEGLWWSDDWSSFTSGDRSAWKWTMMIMQPDFASDDAISEAIDQVRTKKSLKAIDLLRLESFTEGLCVQTLHIGPFSDEGPTIERIHTYIESKAKLRGKHHEIYLSDIRRAAPAKWKTVLRQPMTVG
ncbi:GyrI-like domain-containing protein [Methylicorpusculum oleiharenae]|uniref:GyrI-like domain-containing protein n=1 Tax=Methylicorpusculum oleiharenae TaxID=1338687 RepID=UPI00135A0B4E|nr:GyrI-like domain-containing protein [Methylicorpusculum oleiharenae]MCD2453555.1 GyrI-like domain-containing protein [Methylicorpusculum oleiharenae]